MISTITRGFGGYIALGILFLLFFLWQATVSSERNKQLSALEVRVDDQIRQIEGYKKSISELEQYKFIEQGLREIISEQSLAYSVLEKRNKELQSTLKGEIYKLTPEERTSGSAILKVWDYYEGVTQ